MSQKSVSSQQSERFRDTARRIAAEWERGPIVLQDVVHDPVFTPPDFMTGLLYASRKYLKSPPPPPWRVFVDGRPAAAKELQRLAVQDETQLFEDYAKRLEL